MPTFIKTGFWEKGQKGYKEWLNLDNLIANSIGTGSPGQIAYFGTSGLTGSTKLTWDTAFNKLIVNNTASTPNASQLGFTNPVTILGDPQSPLRVLRNGGQPNIFIGTNSQVPNHSSFLLGIRTGAFYDTAAPKYSGDYAIWIVERANDWGVATSAAQLRIYHYLTCNPNISRQALTIRPLPTETATNTDYVGVNNLLISTAGSFSITPSARLHIRADDNLAAANSIYVENSSATQLLKLNNTGQLLLGAGAFDTYKLDVVGTIRGTQYNLSALNTAPATAASTGTLGEIRIDANHIYVCTATNTWKRVAIATW